MSVTSCICHDQRVLKIAEALSDINGCVTLAGRHRSNCPDGPVPFDIIRFRMIFERGFLFYAFFNIRLFFYLLFHRYDLLVANDLDTLLPNFLVSKLKKIPVVYDSHEYFTDVPEITDRPMVKWIWKTIEKSVFPHLRYVMTVSDSIARLYETEYGIRPLTVRNCSRPSVTISPYTREELGVPVTDLLLILQGTGINIDRGAEELLEAVFSADDVSLLIVGSGDVVDFLKKKTGELKMENRVKFIPPVNWNELIRYTKSADAGVSLDKNSNQNYLYSLPNKLFDYISSGIPVIVSDLPEVSRIVKETCCGLIIDSVTPEKIKDAITILRDNSTMMADLRSNAVKASESLNWNSERIKLMDFYKRIFKESHL